MPKVLVIGIGGLGCPAALALARAGGASLTLIDPDRIDPTNLHRQPWYRTSDVGRLKVECAADRLRRAFPGLAVEARAEAVGAQNAEALLLAHDVAIDGTDGTALKFLLSDASVLTGVPLIHGGVLRMRGQAMRIAPGGPCLRCLFESPPPPDDLPTCAQAGVLGPMAGVIGALQALLALEPPPSGTDAAALFVVDASLRQRTVTVRRAPECRACGPGARERLKLMDDQEPRCTL